MNKLQPSETVLTGRWDSADGRVSADATSRRIETLVADYLIALGSDSSGWDTLYRDPDDGRLWELIYPQSHLHGGGPPELRLLTVEQARQKYGDTVS